MDLVLIISLHLIFHRKRLNSQFFDRTEILNNCVETKAENEIFATQPYRMLMLTMHRVD